MPCHMRHLACRAARERVSRVNDRSGKWQAVASVAGYPEISVGSHVAYSVHLLACLAVYRGHQYLGLYKILIYVEAFVHESIIRVLPPPICIARTIAILLHDFSAVYDAPPTHLLYSIHHTGLAMAISHQGQSVSRLDAQR